MIARTSTPRPADAARVTLGAVLLTRPRLAVRWTSSPDSSRIRAVVRLLGVRYLVQSATGMLVHRPWLRTADSGVDLVHAVSMLGFARELPEHRRMALLSGVAALTFAALDCLDLTERAR
jgi:hypothetical protein